MPLCALALVFAPAQAQMRPHARWQEIETAHFHVVFESGLDELAQHAARRAEAAYSKLVNELGRAPRGKIDIVLGDNIDYTNGAATPVPANRIYLWARPPGSDLALGYYNDWMDLVISHELTHIFHLDRTGPLGRVLRTVFGRVPFGWPIFPAVGTPDWTLEGLATYRESQHTGVGRVYGNYHDMVLRTAVLENDFDPIDRVSGETPMFPGGQRSYIYGSLFMHYIAQRLGSDAHRALLDQTARSWLPPPWVLDGIARNALGKSFSQLYDEWRVDLEHRYRAQADAIRANGVTTSERVAGGERYAFHPRISPDGTRLAYVEENGRESRSTVVMHLATGETSRTRRNSLTPIAWLNHTTLVSTQIEYTDPYTIYSDIYYQLGGSEQRVTRNARYDAVDAHRSSGRLIVVANARGATSLVEYDTNLGSDRVVVEAQPNVEWVSARWNPDGTRIAAQRWRAGGRHDVVVLDTLGQPSSVRAEPWITQDRAMDAAPTWSPDGRWVLFTSDRSGVNNIYAFDVRDASGLVLQVTNLLTGAFYPEISPDGEWIYYSAHHASGFAIERMPFDPQSWRAVSYQPGTDSTAVVIPEHTGPVQPVRMYSAVRSALPKFWLPIIQTDSALGTFLGAFTLGFDDVDRHTYSLTLAYNFENRRTIGAFGYSYAGLGNPVLSFGASREYDELFGESVRREDNVSIRATMLRPRWRSNLALTAGLEGVVVRRDSTARVLDTQDRLLGVIAGVAFGNARVPAYAISPEDGVRVSLTGRRRFDLEPVFRDATYTELSGVTNVYRSIDAFGFAHHVAAARVSAMHRGGLGVGPTDVGGEGDFLPVRGFSDGDRIGFSAWSAALEYRVPIAMIGRGLGLWPLFLDRLSASLFIDAGNAACTAEQSAVYLGCPGNEGRSNGVLVSAGGELLGNVAVLAFVPAWLRLGIAQPIQGPRTSARVYFAIGQSF